MYRILLLWGWCAWSLSAWGQGYTDYIGNGQFNGVQVQSSTSPGSWQTGHVSLDGLSTDSQVAQEDASRFLAMASMGSTYEEIQYTATIGYEAWLNEQFEMTPTYLHPNMNVIARFLIENDEELADELDELDETGRYCEYYTDFRSGWWQTIMTAPDQLRHRVAFALSEILVVSETSDELEDACDGLAHYYDMLVRHSFGNYRDLLYDVSLHPVMGFYLSHYRNPKTDSANSIHPDENYAREVLQLFSIGLYELNLDGSRKLDQHGNPIPTYTNKDIKEYAKVFTGLGAGGLGPDWKEDYEEGVNFEVPFPVAEHFLPMAMYEEHHEPGPKYLLRGEVVPAGQTGLQDIDDAIDNIFHHPNVAPFISRLLIQRLVTSNPTPDYIRRVAMVFENNGQGVRGDMKAVVKAIIMDSEARACKNRVANVNRGMLREPLIRYTHFCRAMGIQPTDEYPYFLNPGFRFDDATGQNPLSSPSVFNFFLPDYQPNGVISDLGLYAPEFQIHNSSTSIAYLNVVDSWTFRESPVTEYSPFASIEAGEDIELYPGATAELSYETWEQLADNPTQFLDRLDLLFTHGQLSSESRTIILTALQSLEDPFDRVNMGVYLILISPDYNVLN